MVRLPLEDSFMVWVGTELISLSLNYETSLSHHSAGAYD